MMDKFRYSNTHTHNSNADKEQLEARGRETRGIDGSQTEDDR